VLAHSPGLARSALRTPDTPNINDEITDGSAEILVGTTEETLADYLCGPSSTSTPLTPAPVTLDVSLAESSYSGGYYVEPEMGYDIRKLVSVDVPSDNQKLDTIVSMYKLHPDTRQPRLQRSAGMSRRK
jgi:hypothetical protein